MYEFRYLLFYQMDLYYLCLSKPFPRIHPPSFNGPKCVLDWVILPVLSWVACFMLMVCRVVCFFLFSSAFGSLFIYFILFYCLMIQNFRWFLSSIFGGGLIICTFVYYYGSVLYCFFRIKAVNTSSI